MPFEFQVGNLTRLSTELSPSEPRNGNTAFHVLHWTMLSVQTLSQYK